MQIGRGGQFIQRVSRKLTAQETSETLAKLLPPVANTGRILGGGSLVDERQRARLFAEFLNFQNQASAFSAAVKTRDPAGEIVLLAPGFQQQSAAAGSDLKIRPCKWNWQLTRLAQTRAAGCM